MNNTIYFEKNRETWTFVNLSQSYFYSVPSDQNSSDLIYNVKKFRGLDGCGHF